MRAQQQPRPYAGATGCGVNLVVGFPEKTTLEISLELDGPGRSAFSRVVLAGTREICRNGHLTGNVAYTCFRRAAIVKDNREFFADPAMLPACRDEGLLLVCR